MEDLIKGVLGTLYKVPEMEIAELIKSEGATDGAIDEKKILQFILDKDKERISKLKSEFPKWEDAVKKATKEVWSKVEKKLKEDFEFDSELQGEELINSISDNAKEKYKSTGKKNELTDDDVKKHPVYLKAENDFKKKFADQEAEKIKAIEEAEKAYTKKEFISKVRKEALLKFKGLENVILPTDPQKADKMIQRLLLDELDAYDYQDDGNGGFLLLDKEGKRVEDAHANPVSFDSMVNNIAKSNFEFKAAEQRRAPSNGQPSGGNGSEHKGYSGKAPASKEEYLGLLTGEDLTTDQKIEVKEQYGAQFSKN